MECVEFRSTDAGAHAAATVETNSRGLPTLRGLFRVAMAACPRARTYTYLNGDILSMAAFVANVEAVLQFSQDFLLVGQRTNVPWYAADNAGFDFGTHSDAGTLFQTDAEGYFVITKDAVDWDTVRPFVVRRPGYDNWLVNYVKVWRKDANVTTVDAAKTLPMLHQTNAAGDFLWGGGSA